MRMCFQKGHTRSILGKFGAWLDRGMYSHTEIQLSDGTCCTSEIGYGVVMRKIDITTDWDTIKLPDSLEPSVIKWYESHIGEPYDYSGNFRFLTGLIGQTNGKWFCVESNLAALSVPEPWRFGPNGAYQLIKWRYELTESK